jgi:hypothetical protein
MVFSVTSDLSGGTYWNEVLSVISVMTLTVFIALCLVGCGFMVVTFSKTSRNKVNVPTAIDSQLVDMEQRTSRFNSSFDYSERLAYERIARSLTPRKGRSSK